MTKRGENKNKKERERKVGERQSTRNVGNSRGMRRGRRDIVGA
jgi:hypothetical protein